MTTKNDALATVPAEGAAVQITPGAMLTLAASKDVDPDKLQKLMDFAERYQANIARQEFNAAMMAFKSEALRISRNITYSDGPLKGRKYADLFGVVDALIPALSKNGLSHSWKITKDEAAWLEITCTIRHQGGHSESVAMGGEPDAGPARNKIQARGSAITYLERYTLLAATGMAAAGQDDDGQRAGDKGGTMGDQAFVSHQDNITNAATAAELQSLYLAAQMAAKEAGDSKAEQTFTTLKNERYRALKKAGRA